MTFAILPVKSLANAKQRLSALLSAPQREALARAMYEEVLAKLIQAKGIDRIGVVTNDESAAEHAHTSGVHILFEPDQQSHSRSADRAALHAMSHDATTVLLLPIDIPLVTTAEIELLAAAARPGIIIVPSADGTGTNALVRTPPDVIESRFGPNSFRAHLDQARAKGVPAEVMRPPGIVFDVDTPEDIAELLRRAPDSRISELLRTQQPSWASQS